VQQEASTALIVSIVAVVLGALGLIGGGIGYVQGTAALRRATLTRQRATVAEEAALQARTRAEQAVRTAQSLLDRLGGVGVRSIGDVADLPTGPLVLAPRLAAGTGASAVPETEVPPPMRTPRAPETESPFGRPVTELVDVPDPASSDSTAAADVSAADPTAVPAGTGPTLLPPATGPASLPPGGSTDVPRAPEPNVGRIESAAETVPVPAPPEGEEQSDPDPEPESEVLAPPQRSATGQVNAAPRGVSPMDWAEVLRTGAIPLPSRSRGTYAAPNKAKGQPIGPVRFEIRAVGRQKFEAVNVGGVTAELAAVEGAGDDSHLVRPLELSAKSVAPGASLAFSVLRVEGRQVSVHLTWMSGGDEEQAELAVP
jgi:hypothetical protein